MKTKILSTESQNLGVKATYGKSKCLSSNLEKNTLKLEQNGEKVRCKYC
jgi:hypothetical protein